MSEQNETNSFERELSPAMKHVNAPETLANFLMAAVEVEAERNVPRHKRKHRWAFVWSGEWAAGLVAALVLLTVSFGEVTHLRHQRESAEATRQFETATRITDQAMAHTREQLRQAGVSLDQQ